MICADTYTTVLGRFWLGVGRRQRPVAHWSDYRTHINRCWASNPPSPHTLEGAHVHVIGFAHVALSRPGAVGKGLVEAGEVGERRRVCGQRPNLLLFDCKVGIRNEMFVSYHWPKSTALYLEPNGVLQTKTHFILRTQLGTGPIAYNTLELGAAALLKFGLNFLRRAAKGLQQVRRGRGGRPNVRLEQNRVARRLVHLGRVVRVKEE